MSRVKILAENFPSAALYFWCILLADGFLMGKKVTITVDVTELGRRGGKARAGKLTPAERSESARRAVNARWERYRRKHPKAKKSIVP